MTQTSTPLRMLAGAAALLAACHTLPAQAQAQAQAQPKPGPGQQIAIDNCSRCHVVTPHGQAGWTDAPAFDAIANRADTTAAKLSAFIQQPHMHMLNLPLPPEQAAALVKYIMSLRK